MAPLPFVNIITVDLVAKAYAIYACVSTGHLREGFFFKLLFCMIEMLVLCGVTDF